MGGVNILSIDGGAMMGVIPARILSYLDGSAAEIAGLPNPLPDIPSIGGPCYESFPYIAGTSTGGLLASALAVAPLEGGATLPLTANQLLDDYTGWGTSIFPGSVTEMEMLAGTTTCFGNSGLVEVITSLFGGPAGAQCLTRSPASGWDKTRATFTPGPIPDTYQPTYSTYQPSENYTVPTVLITSFNNNLSAPPSTQNPLLFQVPVAASIDNSTTPQGPIIITNTTTANGSPISVLQACLMTSAFPMLLPSVPYDLQFGANGADAGTINYFLDGGVYAGSPALAAYLYAYENDLSINSFISIGCGSGGVIDGLAYSTVKEWGAGDLIYSGWMADAGSQPLVKLMMQEPAITIDSLLGKLLPGKYFRLNPHLTTAAAPWSSNPTDLANWVAAADTLVSTLNTLQSGGTNLWQGMIDTIGAA